MLPDYDDDLAWRARAGYLGTWVCRAGGRVLLVVAYDENQANMLIGMQLSELGQFYPADLPYELVPVGIGKAHVLNLGPVDPGTNQ